MFVLQYLNAERQDTLVTASYVMFSLPLRPQWCWDRKSIEISQVTINSPLYRPVQWRVALVVFERTVLLGKRHLEQLTQPRGIATSSCISAKCPPSGIFTESRALLVPAAFAHIPHVPVTINLIHIMIKNTTQILRRLSKQSGWLSEIRLKVSGHNTQVLRKRLLSYSRETLKNLAGIHNIRVCVNTNI